jgi:hypothetical protein
LFTPGGIYILKELLEKIDPELLYADGFDDCILGLTFRETVPVVLYSSSKIIRSLSKDMPYEEAIEYFDFNIGCAYVGERTPVFLTGYLEEDDDT